ncbi:N-acetylglucosamine-6-phosphate deacetylase [Micrococcus sp.]|uniref:N-acetylglucosamine-6-phosphate deacetylase n=1 Tax=Micrococcus sp. TaxID=1271 RepID=UPI002A91EFDF|nr:N-acetylglucosamine-6-phosphate deacetylase [Micrococcus sp.]MDY6055716.1 N-acetylglucosamine-6-phosphate deacetylase [Micrococcus sp.]
MGDARHGALHGALGLGLAADPTADAPRWAALWRPAPDGADTPGTLVWSGPEARLPRKLAARVPRGGWAADVLRLTPPLTDHHVHGGDGVDAATSPTAALRTWLGRRRRAGVGAVLASLPALSAADLAAALERLAPLVHEGALAGVHLEGPFLSPARAGAHHPGVLCTPDSPAGQAVLAVLRQVPEGVVRTVTLAPELPGAERLGAELAGTGIVPCPGHTDADARTIGAAVERWAAASEAWSSGAASSAVGREPVVTHLFNAMRPFHHRDPGPLPTLLAAARRGRVRAEVIADGVHVAPELLQLLFEDPALAPQLVLVSDAVAATDAPAGVDLRLGPATVHAGDDAPRLGPASAGTEACPPLAGGARDLTASVSALLRAGLPADAVLRAAVHTPRRSLPERTPPPGILVWTHDGGRRVLLPAP